jgi:hypothetical protein
LNIPALCAPISTDPEERKKEMVGAIAVVTLDASPIEMDVLATREFIKTASKSSELEFSSKNTFIKYVRANWINMIGTQIGAAPLEGFFKFQGEILPWHIFILMSTT